MNLSQKYVSKNYLFLLITGIAFYLLNQFSPFINDDYYYSFISGSNTPVTCFKDVIVSQVHHYTHWTGRFIIHVIVQSFCGILGIELFQIINSVMFVMLCMGIMRLIQKEFGNKNTIGVVLLLSLAILIPLPGRSFLGNISCSVNYLWSSCFIILFINMYLRQKKDPQTHGIFYNIGIFLFAVICGSLQESFSIGIAGALFLYHCFHRKELNGTLLLLVLGFWIGTCFVVFSPGNFVRAETKAETRLDLFLFFRRCGQLLLDCKALDLLILATVAIFIKNRKKAILFIQHNQLWYTSIIINGVFVVFIAYTGAWQLVCIALFSIILLIKLGYIYYEEYIQRNNKIILNTSFLLLIILYIPIYHYRQLMGKEHQALVQNAHKAADHTIVATKYDSLCTMNNNWFIENYTRPEIYDMFSKRGISLLLTEGKDNNHITSILPQSQQFIVEHCKKENQIKKNIYRIPDYNFFVICLNDSTITNQLLIETTKAETFTRKLIISVWKNAKLNTYKKYCITDLDQFLVNGYRYIIIHNYLKSPIQDINIIFNPD